MIDVRGARTSRLLEAVAGEAKRLAVLRDRPDDIGRGARFDIGLDLQRDADPGAVEAGEVLDDLLRNLRGLCAHAQRVQLDGAMEAAEPCRARCVDDAWTSAIPLTVADIVDAASVANPPLTLPV